MSGTRTLQHFSVRRLSTAGMTVASRLVHAQGALPVDVTFIRSLSTHTQHRASRLPRARCTVTAAIGTRPLATRAGRNEKGYQATIGNGQTLYERHSKFGNDRVRVMELRPWRVLLFNDVEQGLTYMDLASTRDDVATSLPQVLGFDYLRAMVSAAVGLGRAGGCDFFSSVGARCLFVGLGSGALPAFVHHHFPSLQCEVVEIDPVVAFATTKFLGFPTELTTVEQVCLQDADGVAEARAAEAEARAQREARCETHRAVQVALGDAKTFVESREGADAGCIFLDAYDGLGQVPPHLEDVEFLRACASALRPGGLLVANLFNGPEGTPERLAVQDFAVKLARTVGPVCSFKVVEQQTNVVLVAERRDEGSPRCSRGQVNKWANQVGRDFEFSPAKFTDSMLWVDVEDGKHGPAFSERSAAKLPMPFFKPSSAVDFLWANEHGQ